MKLVMINVETYESPDITGGWVVEAIAMDGGIYRTVFIDSLAEKRAKAYADQLNTSGMQL